MKLPQVSGGSRGGLRSSLEPPLRQNHFIFMENFPKNQERIINNQVKLTNRPPFKKSLIRHCKSKCTQDKPTKYYIDEDLKMLYMYMHSCFFCRYTTMRIITSVSVGVQSKMSMTCILTPDATFTTSTPLPTLSPVLSTRHRYTILLSGHIQCRTQGGLRDTTTMVNVNAPVVAFLRTGGGLKGKKIYTC